MSDREANQSVADVSIENGELPEGWAEARLGDLVSPLKEKVEPSESPDAPYLSLEHVEGGTNRIIGRGVGSDVKSTKAVYRSGDVLYGKLRPYLNKVAMPEFDGICSTDFLVFNRTESLQSRFLMYFLSRADTVEFANHHSSGIELPRVGWKSLAKLDFPLPPLAEQKRIVAQVESLLSRASAVRERLAKVPSLLARLRQSVLAAACSGQLTADWREDGSSNGALPASWKRLKLSSLCNRFVYGSSRKSESEGIMPVLRMGNIQDGEVDWTDLKYTSDEGEIEKYSLQPNTVLFNRTNSPELVGKTGIYRGQRPAVFAGYLIRIHHGQSLDPKYLNYCLNSNEFKEYCSVVKTDGVSQSNMNAKKLAAYEMPWCELDEQQEIVRRVDALFALARQVERRLDRSRAAASLVQSILRIAFRGELVETEAELARREGRDYEPASELLNRIRAESEQHNGEKAQPVKRSKRSAARQDGPPKSTEGIRQAERAEEKPAPRRKQNTITAKPPIEEIDRDDVMAGIRELFAGGAELDRNQAIRHIARELGYQRTGSRIQEVLSGHIRSAVRRGIIFNEQGIYAADCRTIDEYPRDELIKNLLAAMGNTWWPQPDAIRAAARHLGFRRTGAKIEKALKSAINGAIRRGLLQRDGGELRRT